MSSARAPRRSARDATGASSSARGSNSSGGNGGGSTASTSAGRERAIEQLIDADPRGPYYRASRIMVSFEFRVGVVLSFALLHIRAEYYAFRFLASSIDVHAVSVACIAHLQCSGGWVIPSRRILPST